MNRREVHYHIRRLPTRVVIIACAPDFDDPETCLVPHLVHHSPTGMEFGYAGGGPADLALSLLTFHLQADAAIVKEILVGNRVTYSGGQDLPKGHPAVRVVRLYQLFKEHALGGHGDDALDLTGRQIDHWIEMTEANLAEDAGRETDKERTP